MIRSADKNTCIITGMGRRETSVEEREHGRQLGLLIAARRMERQRSAPDLARGLRPRGWCTTGLMSGVS